MAVAFASLTAIALLARRCRRVEVHGESMLPTLHPGDRLLVGVGLPLRRGDLAVLHDPAEPDRLVVKRVDDVGPGGISVLGDNPSHSRDSRTYGPVASRLVIGRVLFRYFPPERAGFIGHAKAPSPAPIGRS